MYRITLSDGSFINGLKGNCDYFVTEQLLQPEHFQHKLSGITIELLEPLPEEQTCITPLGYHEHMRLAHWFRFDGKFFFQLTDIPQDELDNIRRDSDIDYLALMTGIEL